MSILRAISVFPGRNASFTPRFGATYLICEGHLEISCQPDILTSRPYLPKTSRRACLCLDEFFQNLLVVTFGSVSSEDPTCSRVSRPQTSRTVILSQRASWC